MSRLPLVCVAISIVVPVIWGSALQSEDKNENLGVSGGIEVSIKSAPFMASLVYWSKITKTLQSFCGGSIIHERFILTAAHCVKKSYRHIGHYKASALKILVGADHLDYESETLWKVEKKICNKRFENVFDGEDICLLKLGQPLKFGPNVAKIDLPDKNLKLEAGTMVKVTGWGFTETSYTMIKDLRQVAVPIVSESDCHDLWSDLKNSEICAGSRGHDACHGDSGGPLTYQNTVVGLVSYGYSCSTVSKGVGVYTRISSYVEWINSVIKKNLP